MLSVLFVMARGEKERRETPVPSVGKGRVKPLGKLQDPLFPRRADYERAGNGLEYKGGEEESLKGLGGVRGSEVKVQRPSATCS